MAHFRDGWHFQRLDDGTVHILVKRSESYDAPTVARVSRAGSDLNPARARSAYSFNCALTPSRIPIDCPILLMSPC